MADDNIILVESKLRITNGLIHDIIYEAMSLEEDTIGIQNWCDEVDTLEEKLGDHVCDQIPKGGKLKLREKSTGKFYELSGEMLLQGITRWVKNPVGSDALEQECHMLVFNHEYIEPVMADAIIQYSIFNKIKYCVVQQKPSV